MTKIISMKELQTKTKKVRQEVEKGTHFIVVWRSKPIFEIKPFQEGNFTSAFQQTELYTPDFISRMDEAQENVRKGRTNTFKNTEEFLKSLS